MSDERDVVTVERRIEAPPEPIFELLVHPDRHRDIDGSGTVRDPKGESQRLEMGSQFGMSMHWGIPYSMVSTVIEYEENRRLAWQTTGPGSIGSHFGGRIWRYELEPVEGGTVVRESWDISQESAVTRPLVRRGANQTRKNMAATLERIDQLVTA
ncbi:MAG TPA: SRPBCC family protein [Acidimicrobiales bacterium]|nr:SRPBCC family protein [Acidimicrobiales bacterium]